MDSIPKEATPSNGSMDSDNQQIAYHNKNRVIVHIQAKSKKRGLHRKTQKLNSSIIA